ncbi:MAG: hypothetical protein HFE99_02290 [Ruminiclostridium sp.]|jgi:hypothetical protein|nr:hypothetical protein [Ruminiclostridium sp.]
MMKRKLTVCLVAGVLILAVSAGAAFGSVNGYAAYKNGAKKLLLETDNVTLKGSYSISVDGQELDKVSASHAKEGKNWDSRSSKQIRGEAYETVDVMHNGVNSWYSSDMEPNTYYSYKSDSPGDTSLLGIDQDSELEQRMVTFLELAADTVVGDLKNNFVAIGKEDGVSKYQVDISKSQVPAVVNAGLSLMAYSSASVSANSSYVVWEDQEATMAAYYQEKTGSALTQELIDNYIDDYNEEWAEANEDLVDEYNEVTGELYDKYYDMLEDKGDTGVLYVAADGSTTHYASEKDYFAAHQESADTMVRLNDILGEDMALETVSCTFSVDDQGRLTENSLTATFSTKDMEGKDHSLTLTANVTASDYGTTKVQPLNLDGWTNLSQDD